MQIFNGKYRPAAGSDGQQPSVMLQFSSACFKCMSGIGLRQATGFVESLMRLFRFNWPVPDYSTLCRRQKGLCVAITSCPNTVGLHLPIDSTGVMILSEGEMENEEAWR